MQNDMCVLWYIFSWMQVFTESFPKNLLVKLALLSRKANRKVSVLGF